VSIIKVSTRGNEIQWTATFKDFSGVLTSPASAALHVVYEGSTATVAVTVAMTSSTAGEWAATWDSSVAAAGNVEWNIKATGPSISVDGSFKLSANDANPDPV